MRVGVVVFNTLTQIILSSVADYQVIQQNQNRIFIKHIKSTIHIQFSKSPIRTFRCNTMAQIFNVSFLRLNQNSYLVF